MSTFKLGKVEFVQQSQGFSSVIKVQVSSLTSDECGAIPWDEFQVLSLHILFLCTNMCRFFCLRGNDDFCV
jgi:hypothetical protein